MQTGLDEGTEGFAGAEFVEHPGQLELDTQFDGRAFDGAGAEAQVAQRREGLSAIGVTRRPDCGVERMVFVRVEAIMMKKTVRYSLVWLFLLLLACRLQAGRNPQEPDEPTPEIQSRFYLDGKPSLQMVDRFRRQAQQRYRELTDGLERYYRLLKGDGPKKVQKKLDRKAETVAYRLFLDYVDKLADGIGGAEFLPLARTVVRLDFALRCQARSLASVELLRKLPVILKSKRIPIRKVSSTEAVNLVNRQSGALYSQAELSALKERGVDISRLNPGDDSSLWVDHDVSAVDVRRHYESADDPLHRGIVVYFPLGKAYYKKVRKTQSRPKVDLYIDHAGRRLEYKLKLGAEVHAEPTCAALIMTLGFSADITRHVRDFKVVLGEASFLDFRREWESYFDSRYRVDDFVKDLGRDEEGNYVVFHEGLLEYMPEELLRIGPWAYGAAENSGLREVRGLLLFNLWVANLDLKESENNKLIARKVADRTRFFQIQHDMGYALGGVLPERPGSFPWQLVRKKTANYVVLNFPYQYHPGLVEHSLFRHVTFADARWMVRLIARLSRRQIQDAVFLGAWPAPLDRLLVEKLIARRNQLVTAFDLVGEATPEGSVIGLLPFDRLLTSEDGAVRNGELTVYRFPGRPQYYGPWLNDLVKGALTGLRNGAVDTLVDLVGSVRHLDLSPEWLGLDRRLIGKVCLHVHRQVQVNPAPRSEAESFLVKDTLDLGIRLGYGSVLSGDITHWRRLSLVYPVASRDAGRFHNRFLIDLALYRSSTECYPRHSFVLVREDSLEGRGRLALPHGDSVGMIELTGSRVSLRRQLLGYRSGSRAGKLVYWEDEDEYREKCLNLVLTFWHTLRVVPANFSWRRGCLDRRVYEMDVSEPDGDPLRKAAVERLVREGDGESFKGMARVKAFRNEYQEERKRLSLFGALLWSSLLRVDRLSTAPAGEGAAAVDYRVESRKLRQWRFFDNGERRQSIVRMTGGWDSRGLMTEPQVEFEFRIDDRSIHAVEFNEAYLGFINALLPGRELLPFSPELHTVDGMWGHTRMTVRIVLSAKAVENILQAREGQIWAALADVTLNPADHTGKTKSLMRSFQRLGTTKAGPDRLKKLVRAFGRAVRHTRHGYDPTLPALLLKLAGQDELYLDALLTVPGDKEQILPGEIPYYNEFGVRRQEYRSSYGFVLEDAADIYGILF